MKSKRTKETNKEIGVALLRGGAWIEIISMLRRSGIAWSHSFAGVRGLKYCATIYIIWYLFVALLRGGAWIEIKIGNQKNNPTSVALLRGGAWIEIP